MYFAHATTFKTEPKQRFNVFQAVDGHFKVFGTLLNSLGFNAARKSLDGKFVLLNHEEISDLLPKMRFELMKSTEKHSKLLDFQPTRYRQCLIQQPSDVGQEISNFIHLSTNFIYIVHGLDQFHRDESIARLNRLMCSLDESKNLFVIFKTYDSCNFARRWSTTSIASLPPKRFMIENRQTSAKFIESCKRLNFRKNTYVALAQNDWHTSFVFSDLLETVPFGYDSTIWCSLFKGEGQRDLNFGGSSLPAW